MFAVKHHVNLPRRRAVRGYPVEADILAKLKDLVVSDGDREAAVKLGVSRHTLARAISGFPLMLSTRTALSAYFRGQA